MMNTITPPVFDEGLLQRIRRNLGNFDIRTHEKNGAARAAVAITIVEASDAPGDQGAAHRPPRDRAGALILTRRASTLRNHSGQWAFPGGRMDPGETPEAAALRELSEEVGLALDRDRVLGRLDDFTTRSGFTITPVVAWGGPGVELTPNPEEVASIHRIPISEFMREDAPTLQENPGGGSPILLMPVGENFIAAPTAALIYQFREAAILGNETRVAHYEQPYFAWS